MKPSYWMVQNLGATSSVYDVTLPCPKLAVTEGPLGGGGRLTAARDVCAKPKMLGTRA